MALPLPQDGASLRGEEVRPRRARGMWALLLAWESRPRGQVASLAALLVLIAPLAYALVRGNAGASASSSSTWKLASGFTALAFLLSQLLLGARRRIPGLPGDLEKWRAVHKAMSLVFVGAVLAHAGLRGGVRLTAWLVATMIVLTVVAQAGHIAKTWAADRAEHEPQLDRMLNDENGALHRLGLGLHVTLAGVLIALVLVHAVSVFYF